MQAGSWASEKGGLTSILIAQEEGSRLVRPASDVAHGAKDG